MRTNLDKFLLRFLKDDGYLYQEIQYNRAVLYRFRLINSQIYVETLNPEIVCSLGDFERVTPLIYKVNYFYDADCLIKCRKHKDPIINAINKSVAKNDTKQKLLLYLENKLDKVRSN